MRVQVYANMLDMLDSGLGNVSATLKATGYWANTLLVFSAVSATPSPFFSRDTCRSAICHVSRLFPWTIDCDPHSHTLPLRVRGITVCIITGQRRDRGAGEQLPAARA